MKLQLSNSTLSDLIFTTTQKKRGLKLHPIDFIEKMLACESWPKEKELLAIDFEKKQQTYFQPSSDFAHPISSQEAVTRFLKFIKQNWTPAENFFLFKDVIQLKIDRYEHIILDFAFRDDRRFVFVVRDPSKNIGLFLKK